jgi:DNA-binding PadR family transcriptional regulator
MAERPVRRKVGNLLAVPLLTCLQERPMHPYEMAALLRERGKDASVDIHWGSLYTVVNNLNKHGFIEAVGTSRQGRKPERTVYRITEAGRTELRDWLRELVGVPEREYTRFEAGLSDAGALPPDEVSDLLRRRVTALEEEIAAQQRALDAAVAVLPRVFLVEAEYHLAMCRAEAGWIHGLLKEITDGTLSGVREWRAFHERGEIPPDLAAWQQETEDRP